MKDNWKWFFFHSKGYHIKYFEKLLRFLNVFFMWYSHLKKYRFWMPRMRFLMIQCLSFRVPADIGSKARCAKKIFFFFLLQRIVIFVLSSFYPFCFVEAKAFTYRNTSGGNQPLHTLSLQMCTPSSSTVLAQMIK